jgi:hypothetical protein
MTENFPAGQINSIEGEPKPELVEALNILANSNSAEIRIAYESLKSKGNANVDLKLQDNVGPLFDGVEAGA